MARPFKIPYTTEEEIAAATAISSIKKKRLPSFKFAITVLLIGLFSTGAVYYYAAIFEPPWKGPRCQVEGAVENPLSFHLSDFKHHETTISAELIGRVTHIPPQDYTGIPLKHIIKEAAPFDNAQNLRVIASDGYEVEFNLQEVLNDDKLVLIQEDDMLRLIAANYDGGYWVKLVNKIIIE